MRTIEYELDSLSDPYKVRDVLDSLFQRLQDTDVVLLRPSDISKSPEGIPCVDHSFRPITSLAVTDLSGNCLCIDELDMSKFHYPIPLHKHALGGPRRKIAHYMGNSLNMLLQPRISKASSDYVHRTLYITKYDYSSVIGESIDIYMNVVLEFYNGKIWKRP